MEAVTCASCGSPYDSLEHAFCPRCGTTERDKAVATLQQMGSGEKEKKMKRAGIVLSAIGAIGVLLFAFAAFGASALASDGLEPMLSEQDGGTVVVVFGGDNPIANATVMLRHADGELLAQGQTNSNGTYSSAVSTALVNVTVEHNGESWTRKVMALAPGTQHVRLSPSDAATSDKLVGVDIIVKIVMGAGIVFMILSGLMLFAGIQLIRAKSLGFGLLAAAVGVIPAFIFLFASLNFGSILLLGALVWAIVNLMSARKL